jgi:hypothetical protein
VILLSVNIYEGRADDLTRDRERADRGSVVVAADVNSTTDMRPFRALLHDGYRDDAEQSGAGIKPTLPGRHAATGFGGHGPHPHS